MAKPVVENEAPDFTAHRSYPLTMVSDVQQLLESAPFQPFTVVTTGGARYAVRSADHASLNPRGTRVVIWFDDDSSVTIAGLHIAAIEKGAVDQNAKD